MGWAGRGGSYRVSFQADLWAVPTHHAAVHWQLVQEKWQKGADQETKRATEPTHSSFLLDQFKLAVKLKSQGCMFGFSCCDCWQSATSPGRLHANTYLYSWAAVQAGASEAFRASVGSPRGIAFLSLVDLCGARSLLRQTGPGPGHGDIWLVCGCGAGCQGCRQHSSWTLAWTLQLACFKKSILVSSCGHFSTWIWLHRSIFNQLVVTSVWFGVGTKKKQGRSYLLSYMRQV